ncbi:MAG: glycosyltransferase family A protein [Patescibacteria group bacterium]
MNINKPLVSVLICSHNAEKFIKSTLTSVLNQTYRNIEILILDNDSTDNTVPIIRTLALHSRPLLTYEVKKGPSVRLIEGKENIGPYRGLNLLLNLAKGKYIAINDHDDIWHPEKIEKQVTFLEANKEYAGCGTAIINRYEKYATSVYRARNKEDSIAWHTSLVFRNEGYRYDESIPIGGDFYFMEKVLCGSKKLIYNFEEPMVLRRIFNVSRNLSSEWMSNFSLSDLLKLNLPITDKLAILNRILLPRELIEWIIVKVWGNNIPNKYHEYATIYQIA